MQTEEIDLTEESAEQVPATIKHQILDFYEEDQPYQAFDDPGGYS